MVFLLGDVLWCDSIYVIIVHGQVWRQIRLHKFLTSHYVHLSRLSHQSAVNMLFGLTEAIRSSLSEYVPDLIRTFLFLARHGREGTFSSFTMEILIS